MEIQYVHKVETAHSITNTAVEFPPDWLQEPSLKIRKIKSFSPRSPSELKIRRLKVLDAASPLQWLKKWKVFQYDDSDNDKDEISGESVLNEECSISSASDCKVKKNIAIGTSNSNNFNIVATPCVNAKATEKMVRVSGQNDGYPRRSKRKQLMCNSANELIEAIDSKRPRTEHGTSQADQTTKALTKSTDLELSKNDMNAEDNQESTKEDGISNAEVSCDKMECSTLTESSLPVTETERWYPTRISGFKLNLNCPPVDSLIQKDHRTKLSWLSNPIAFNAPLCRVYYSGFSIRSKTSNCKVFMGDYIEISTLYLPKARTAQIVSCYQAINPRPFKYKDIVNGNTVIVQEKGKDSSIEMDISHIFLT
jgi:hypothetical protein